MIDILILLEYHLPHHRRRYRFSHQIYCRTFVHFIVYKLLRTSTPLYDKYINHRKRSICIYNSWYGLKRVSSFSHFDLFSNRNLKEVPGAGANRILNLLFGQSSQKVFTRETVHLCLPEL